MLTFLGPLQEATKDPFQGNNPPPLPTGPTGTLPVLYSLFSTFKCICVCACVRRVHFQAPITSHWRRRQHGPLTRWYPTTTLHGVTTQKTTTWNFIVVKGKIDVTSRITMSCVWPQVREITWLSVASFEYFFCIQCLLLIWSTSIEMCLPFFILI
jgi:hypothetical protein